MSKKECRIVSNSDNELLGPIVGKGLIIGYVDKVNGIGAKEVPEFIPTRYELLQIVKHWAREILRINYFYSIPVKLVAQKSAQNSMQEFASHA